jgi:hypothetical protein
MIGKFPELLITVSSPDYLYGTQVMLHSFYAHNPWFDGEVIVLHSRLSDRDVALLECKFPHLRCRCASVGLEHAVRNLVQAFPRIADRQDRFLSLEALLLDGPWPRLFLDSDVLVCGDLFGMTEHFAPVIACPDATMLRGRHRHEASFVEIDHIGGSHVKSSFNSGLILIQEGVRDTALNLELLDLLSPQRWQAVASDHTDQVVWNQLFRGRVELIEPAYNFMLGHAALYGDTLLKDLRLLHFNGPAKPWLPYHSNAASNQSGIVAEAFEAWRLAYKAMLRQAP